MRVNDGSICSNCKHFEHVCDLDNGCLEQCDCNDKKVREIFANDYDKIITECSGYENR